MDEFAALLEEEGPPAEDDVPSPADEEGMDEFASLLEFELAPAPDTSTGPSPPAYSRHSTTVQTKKRKPSTSTSTSSSSHRSTSRSENKSSSTTPAATAVATVGVDERLGIRMINRQMSSLDLLDLITTTAPYLSPARMGAMSSQALCGILVDPPSIVDRATVQGRTHLVTVGLVFENSGTKTSAKGGAFVILKIGSNLESGPCLSVFLFGTAYSKYGKIRAGQVIALSNPKLLPARDDNGRSSDTSLSLSVHDVSQLDHVAKARDYGVCKASVSGKQPDGTWKKNAANCKSFVDMRSGDFCPFHAKKQKQKNGHVANCSSMRGVGGVSNSGVSRRAPNMVQEHKTAKIQWEQTHNNNNNNKNNNSTAGNRFLGNRNSVGAVGQNVSSSLNSNTRNNPYLAEKQKHLTTSNSAPAMGNVANTTGIDMHMKKDTNQHQRQQQRQMMPSKADRSGGSAGSVNRYISKSTKRKASDSQPTSAGPNTSKKEKTSTSSSGDWLQEASRRKPASKSLSSYISSNSDKKPARKVNTMGCGLDGSVVVPKPSKLFNNQVPKISRSTASMATDELKEAEANKIKEKQACLAEKMRREKHSGGASVDKAASKRSAKARTSSTSSGNSFLDSIQVDDVEAVLNQKSKFAGEAEAEDYARRRRRLVELEIVEGKDNKRQSAKQDKENQKIQTVWVCHTCEGKPRFGKSPTQCYMSCHEVKKERQLKQSANKADERTKLHEKGGLTLGSGLEWSKNPFGQLN